MTDRRRRWPALLGLAALAMLVPPYLQGLLPPLPLALLMAAGGVAAWLHPRAALAALLGLAPLLDVAMSRLVLGHAFAHEALAATWIEPLALGMGLGLMAGRLPGRGPAARRPLPSGLVLLMAIIGASALASLTRTAADWSAATPTFLAMAWEALPRANPLAGEFVGRATLLLLAGPLVALAFRTAYSRWPDDPRPWRAWIAGSLLTNAVGAWWWWRGVDRAWPYAASLMADRNAYGSWLVLTLFIGLAVARQPGSRSARFAGLLSSALALVMLLACGSRVALLAALAVGVCWIGWSWRRSRAPARLQRLRWAAVALLAVAWLAATVTPSRIGVTLTELASPQFLLEHLSRRRLPAWHAAGEMAMQHPFTGVGPGGLYSRLGLYLPEASPSAWPPLRENAHNYFLQLAGEIGVAGMLAFAAATAALIGGGLAAAGAAWSPAIWPLVAGGIAYLITLLSGHALLLPAQIVLFWGYLGLMAARLPAPAAASPGRGLPAAFAAGLLLLALGMLTSGREMTCAIDGYGGRPAATVEPAAGFEPVETSVTGSWSWMGRAGQLRVCASAPHAATATLSLRAASLIETRRMEVRVDGHSLGVFPVGAQAGEILIEGVPLRAAGTSLILLPRPGAVRISSAAAGSDRRRVSIQLVGRPRLIPDLAP